MAKLPTDATKGTGPKSSLRALNSDQYGRGLRNQNNQSPPSAAGAGSSSAVQATDGAGPSQTAGNTDDTVAVQTTDGADATDTGATTASTNNAGSVQTTNATAGPSNSISCADASAAGPCVNACKGLPDHATLVAQIAALQHEVARLTKESAGLKGWMTDIEDVLEGLNTDRHGTPDLDDGGDVAYRRSGRS